MLIFWEINGKKIPLHLFEETLDQNTDPLNKCRIIKCHERSSDLAKIYV